MVSIIIPTYNEASVLPKMLESIFKQTYTDFEIILINDGSTDNTDDVVHPYLDRITYIRQAHLDRQITRNNGIALSRGKYLLVCDCDIIMRPDMIERMVHVLDTQSVYSFVYSSFRWGWKKFSSFPFDEKRLRTMNYINTASLVRREHHPGFDVRLRKFQDWDVWLSMASCNYKGYFIPEVLFSLGENKKNGLSAWLPRVAYKIPWHWIGIHIGALDRYEDAKKIIEEKHHL